jgi:hypothetical protein
MWLGRDQQKNLHFDNKEDTHMSSDNYEDENGYGLKFNLLIISHSFHLWANLKPSGLGPLTLFYIIEHGEKEAFTCYRDGAI